MPEESQSQTLKSLDKLQMLKNVLVKSSASLNVNLFQIGASFANYFEILVLEVALYFMELLVKGNHQFDEVEASTERLKVLKKSTFD